MPPELESKPKPGQPQSLLNTEQRTPSRDETVEPTTVNDVIRGTAKSNSYLNSPIMRYVKKKVSYRKTHGVQFQKQVESLNISAGPSFPKASSPSTNPLQSFEGQNNETPPPETEALELDHLERFIDRWQYFRYRCGLLINDVRVQLFLVNLIAINAIMMGIATFDFVKDDPQVLKIFDVTDLVFLIFFTVELGMQFIFYGFRLFTDGWLVFDLIIITLSWAFSQVQIIRSFRIFRAFRLITRIKVLKNLVLALFSVVPRMFAIGILLLLVSYIFAVLFTQLFKDLYKDGYTEEDYFGRMDKTFFTLFQLMTLDNWANVAREVIAVYSWAWIPFIVFVIATGFVVVNLIIAVICDAISALREDEKAKLHGTYEENSQESSSNKPEGDDDDQSIQLEEAAKEEDEYHVEVDVRAQLDSLEQNVSELSQMQEDALHALEILMQNLQARGLQDNSHSSSSSVYHEDDGTAVIRILKDDDEDNTSP
ncbi:voltage-gated sodium channel type XI alpha [Fistulifera solaris]|uniref:Voltage-gated sodium channel type XI alpha n=1 Tax=Fistulifera solaris TaxID=1519565 RepID=A0A1Z5JAH4_FISSO|nr:voltage-gated sodium channel type XI alpha [Fistulifera solaris]|eukprot:GAX10990.1 voltage-gated sodium channel type XI alpha [Fistulifera solaris]